MSETLPRFGLDPVDYVETDAAAIETEMTADYESDFGRTLAPGDPMRLLLLWFADKVVQVKSEVNIAAQQNNLAYATGKYLDVQGDNMVVSRLQASPAITTLRFTLSEALGSPYTIPAGTEVGNGVVFFATDEEITIPAGNLTGDVGATCTTAGEAGNGYLPGQVTTIVKPLPFVSGASNTTTTEGGADIESDARFAERVRVAPNTYSVAGPKKAYEALAKNVSPAIIDVSVDSPNPGEVMVYPLLEGGALPGADLIDAIGEYLSDDTRRPDTDYVQVLAPTPVEFSINVEYWINKDDLTRSQTIRENVEAAVESYRAWQQNKIGRDISPAKLIAAVSNAGASRIEEATFSPGAYVKLNPYSVAQCSGVTVTYMGYKDE